MSDNPVDPTLQVQADQFRPVLEAAARRARLVRQITVNQGIAAIRIELDADDDAARPVVLHRSLLTPGHWRPVSDRDVTSRLITDDDRTLY